MKEPIVRDTEKLSIVFSHCTGSSWIQLIHLIKWIQYKIGKIRLNECNDYLEIHRENCFLFNSLKFPFKVHKSETHDCGVNLHLITWNFIDFYCHFSESPVEKSPVTIDIWFMNVQAHLSVSRWQANCIELIVKVHLWQEKMKAEANFFFDIVHFSFYLFRFQLRFDFRSV